MRYYFFPGTHSIIKCDISREVCRFEKKRYQVEVTPNQESIMKNMLKREISQCNI